MKAYIITEEYHYNKTASKDKHSRMGIYDVFTSKAKAVAELKYLLDMCEEEDAKVIRVMVVGKGLVYRVTFKGDNEEHVDYLIQEFKMR